MVDEAKEEVEEATQAWSDPSPPRLGSPELMKEWYDEDKYLDFFVYHSVRSAKSKKLRQNYSNRHNDPPPIPDWVESLQTLASVCGLLFMQTVVPVAVCVQYSMQLIDIYKEGSRPERDPSMPQVFKIVNRLAGCVFMFGAIRVMVSDINNLGNTYFAFGKWHSISGRRLRWMGLGMVANIFSILATEFAMFTSFLLTNELLDFVFNFAALFVLYQVDAFILSSDEKAEITRFVEELEEDDMDIQQDYGRDHGFYKCVHLSFLLFYLAHQYLLQFALPILFAIIY